MPHKLLLADDSVTIQRVIELTFADEDVRSSAVGDGRRRSSARRPIARTSSWPTSACPERDGYEVAAFIKAIRSSRTSR